MTQDQLRQWLRRTPFIPFRVHISSGDSYAVSSPDWMMVTPRYTSIGVPGESGDGDIIITIDNLHITHLVPTPVPANGERQ